MARPKQPTARPKKIARRAQSQTARASKEAVVTKPAGPRRLRKPRYRHFRLHKRIKHPIKLSGSYRLFWRAGARIVQNWKLIGGVLLVYAALNIFFVKGLSIGANVNEIKTGLNAIFGQHSNLFGSVGFYAILVTTAGSAPTAVAGSYQAIFVIITSLALIWAFRNAVPGVKVRIRDSFYRGPSQVIPFLLVMLVIGLQLVPMLMGASIYITILRYGIAVTAPEKVVWLLLFSLTMLLSLYMVTSSIFALYIVTLPGMAPLKSLKTARELVRFRRWTLMRKVLFMPVGLVIVSAAIVVPVVLFSPLAGQWIFFTVTVLALGFAHSYMYGLYRELL